MSFDGENITSLDTVELLRITLNKKINFKRHITNICHKANNKAKALFRIRKFLNLEQVLTEAYISSNFSYCPLIWMFCGKVSDNFCENPLQNTREKDGNRADLCLPSIVFSFESSRVWCSLLVIKMAVRFFLLSGLPQGEDESGINSAFFKTNYWIS